MHNLKESPKDKNKGTTKIYQANLYEKKAWVVMLLSNKKWIRPKIKSDKKNIL